MTSFSFSFAGDDIEEDSAGSPTSSGPAPAEPKAPRRLSSTAFPVAGQVQLPAQKHELEELLSTLPSKIAYSTLTLQLDDAGETVHIPRRELWDVRVQLMAEDDEAGLRNLGSDDVKTGVYEGGFKSWESSLDLVRVLAAGWRGGAKEGGERSRRVLELGCGTALPSLAVLQWHLLELSSNSQALQLTFADYNPAVLQLVTVPNILLSWAQTRAGPDWEAEGELELDSALFEAFRSSLATHAVSLNFLSGSWSPEFTVHFTGLTTSAPQSPLLVLAAETIYSPAALYAFADTLMAILTAEQVDTISGAKRATALVAAKKVYFGVGGSIEDFCAAVGARAGLVEQLREEEDGVRRAVVGVRVVENSG